MNNLLKNEYGKGIAIALVIIVLFTAGNFVGSLTAIKSDSGDAVATVDTTVANTTAAPVNTTAAPVVAETTTAAPATDDTTAAPAANDTTEAPATTGAPTTTAEVIAYYNEAANKIKPNATQIVRNYQDMRHNAEKLELPSAVQSIGEGLISTFLKKDETPVTWTGADITANFPVNGADHTSKLTEADVVSATCTDNGSTYEITIVAKTVQNPDPSSNFANSFEYIKESDVMDAAGTIVKTFNTEYYDCTINCTVDKATGNITHYNFATPIVMNVDTKLFVSGTVGMTFEKDYTITY